MQESQHPEKMPPQQKTPHFLQLTSVRKNGPEHPPIESVTVTRIDRLTRKSAPIDCPWCGLRAFTERTYQTGRNTCIWSLFCCLLCIPCMPFQFKRLKNVRHSCGNCGVGLALVHKHGLTLL